MSFPPNHGTELETLMRHLDGVQSPIGPAGTWSASLKTSLSLLLATEAQIVLFWGPQWIAFYNDAYAPTIGDKHPRALGRPAKENWRELWDDLEPLLRGVRETGKTFAAKDRPFYIERHGYGETAYFDVSYSAVPEADGSVGGVLCIVSETTQRVLGARRQASLLQLEDALRHTKDADAGKQIAVALLYRELAAAGVTYAEVDMEASALHVVVDRRSGDKPSATRMPDSKVWEYCSEACRTGEPSFGRSRFSGSCHDAAESSVLALPVQRHGQTVAVFSVEYPPLRRWMEEDIQFARAVAERTWAAAERIRAEALLRESEARQRQEAERVQCALAAGAIIGTWFWDLRSNRLTIDEKFAANFGLDPAGDRDNLSLEHIAASVHPDDKAEFLQAITRALGHGGHYAHQYRVRRADGHYYWTEANGRVNTAQDGTPFAFPGVLIDVESRRQAERRLAESEAKYKTLFDEIDEGFCVIEFLDGPHGILDDYVHVEANPAFTANTGIADIIGKSVRELLPEEADSWVDVYRRVLLTGESVRFERELASTGRYLELAAFRVEPPERGQVAVLVKDVTARKQAETELQLLNRELAERVAQAIEQREAALARVHEMQKLETIGQLTGGVAHDFNNLLTPIVGVLDMLSRHHERDERIGRLIGSGLQAAERARTLVQRLLAFARRQHLEARPIDIRNLVTGMEDLLARSLGPQIALQIECAANLSPAMIDPNQLELALLNLAVNARDAMPEGGQLKITVNEECVEGPSKLVNGPYIRVAVSDTGVGMDAKTIKRAVEPFFTTKAKGQGTGLGLSMVHGLAAQSGGDFALSSVPGRGTTATLWLPVSVEQIDASVEPVAGKTALRCVQGTPVLLVDDEELVRAGTAEMLAHAGYVVRQAASGHQALAMLKDGLVIEALITDYAMPGMTGAELAREAVRLRPALPVLMITGFASLKDRISSDLPRLSKPFRQIELTDALAELLRQPGRA